MCSPVWDWEEIENARPLWERIVQLRPACALRFWTSFCLLDLYVSTPKSSFSGIQSALNLKAAFDAFYLIRHRHRTAFITQSWTYFALDVRKKLDCLFKVIAEREMIPIYGKDLLKEYKTSEVSLLNHSVPDWHLPRSGPWLCHIPKQRSNYLKVVKILPAV